MHITEKERRDFLRENPNWKKNTGRRKDFTITLWLRCVQWIFGYVSELGFLRVSPVFLIWERGFFILHWAVGLDCDDHGWDVNVLHVVKAVIIGVGLLGLHVRNLTTIHNCPFNTFECGRERIGVTTGGYGRCWDLLECKREPWLQMAPKGRGLQQRRVLRHDLRRRSFRGRECDMKVDFGAIWSDSGDVKWRRSRDGPRVANISVGGMQLYGHVSPSWWVSIFDHYRCPLLFYLPEPARGKLEEQSW